MSAERPTASSDEAAKRAYADLVRAAAGGDRGAMEQLLMRSQEAAYRFSLLVCGHTEDAEDVMQEALLKTYRYVRDIANPEAFRTWLYRTVQTACLMKRRRRAGEPSQFMSLEQQTSMDGAVARTTEMADPASGADQKLIDASTDRRVRSALQALPPAYRMIVVMREMEGLSTREVAEVTGYSEANVKTRLRRARLMLRRYLEAS
jgi:RNA polymerase sigma-70 factor (ECF subfamily)